MGNLAEVLEASAVGGRRHTVLRRDGAELAWDERLICPRRLVESLISSVFVRAVYLKEVVHKQRREEAYLADDTGQRAGRVSAPGEAKDEDFVSWPPVV